MRPSGLLAAVFLSLQPTAGVAKPPPEESPLPPPTRTPQLVISHNGPHAPITALAFAPDGTLYVGGFGKLVHRYILRAGKFVPAGEPIRVPIGSGNAGAVNAVAVSPDGKWVAVAGRAPVRGEVWAGADDGVVVETRFFPPHLKRDYGVVYLFDPANPRGGKVIRGLEAGVRALAFATPGPAAGPVLVTAGVEWDREEKTFGTVRVHDVTTGKELASRRDLPSNPTRPGLAAWASGEKGKTLQVAVAWPQDKGDSKLLVWDVGEKRDELYVDGKANYSLVLRTDNDGATKEVISGGYLGERGHIVARPVGHPADAKTFPLGGNYPVAVAPVGNDTAVLLKIPPLPPATTWASELRLVAADGRLFGQVLLDRVDNNPMLAASLDGRYVAVGGFADYRIEVYNAAALLTGKASAQTLAGAPGGYTRVAFLAGNRLWLGGKDDVAFRGGTVLDLTTRKAASGAGDDRLDGPTRSESAKFATEPIPNTKAIAVRVEGNEQKFPLREAEWPTAVAVLPAGPLWDKALPAVVAVAHYHTKTAVALVTLFDATDGRRLLQLDGPTLRVDGLAFAGTRPLLAAVGADRVVSLWSLKNLAAPFAAIEGLTMIEGDAAITVGSVASNSPVRNLLAADDVVASVGAEKGDLKPVKTYREFLLAVREIPVGKTARLQIQGKPVPIVVPVGRGVGHRHPLFDLWVNPITNADGCHDWIGWTPAGPYDTNSPAAEARLGWLTATGSPAEPVIYAGADQYRRLYYKSNFLRFLADEGDFSEAWKRFIAENLSTPPELTIRTAGSQERDGLILQRTKPAGLDVELNAHENVLTLDGAVLRWRSVGRDGKAGDWHDLPLTTVHGKIELPGYVWSRGSHRFEVALHETAELPAIATTAITLDYVPSAPILTVRVNSEKVADGQDVTSAKEQIEITADVVAAKGEEVVVTLSTSGKNDEEPLKLSVGKDGRFGPIAVKLQPDSKTGLRLTATNVVATGNTAPYESTSAGVIVWHAPPKPRPVPQVRLSVASAVDTPTIPGKPFVSDTPKVRLSATITAENLERLEWDDGDGKWADSEFKPANPKAATTTRDVTIAVGGKPRTLRIRVTAGGVSQSDAVDVLWAGLPEADIAELPATVRDSNLLVRGPVHPVPGGGPFTARVVVDSPDPVRPRREFDTHSEKPASWNCNVSLSPGVNRLCLVIGNEWKQVRIAMREVRYIRPPLVVAIEPIAARGANLGDVVAVVVAPAGVPPDRLTLDDRILDAKPVRGPVRVCGLALWWLKAEAVPLEVGGELTKGVRVGAHNADGDGPAIEVAVRPKPPEPPPPPPPTIMVTTGLDKAILSPGGIIPTDQPEFSFGLKVSSAVKLVRIDVRRQPDRLPGVPTDATIETPDGFVLEAKTKVKLREGVNTFEVEATTAHKVVKFAFTVSYTPPPVRVIIDSIEEANPNGGFIRHPIAAWDGSVEMVGGFVRVRGRVVWAGSGEAAKGAGHEVVLVANEVRHLPVELAAPPGGGTEASFVVPLFLNANQVHVRIEINSMGLPLAQQKVADQLVRTRNPLGKQRLHLLVIAPQAKETQRKELARVVITAIGGTYPPSDPAGDRGEFTHKSFATATLYRPLVHAVEGPTIDGLLHDVREQIEQAAKAPGAQGWVNDVVLVYYRGSDMIDRKGRLCLHTTDTLAGRSKEVVPVAELPPTPGVRLIVLNVVNPDGAGPPTDPVRAAPLLLRYVWPDAKGADGLPELYRMAVNQKPKVGDVVDWVGEMVKNTVTSDPLTGKLPTSVRERPIGVGNQP